MDLKANYLLETCSDPIGFLNQLRQTTEPIGGGTVYSEDGELVEYDVAVEAIKKANDAFIEKAIKWLKENAANYVSKDNQGEPYLFWVGLVEGFINYMKGK
jgi:hypothetical protein